MREKIDQIHALLPAEVTAAYLAVRGVLVTRDIGESEYMWEMMWLVAVLILVNFWICYAHRGFRKFGTHVFFALGVAIWTANIDMPRFEDVPGLGPYIEIAAPVALVLYTLISGLMRPQEKVK